MDYSEKLKWSEDLANRVLKDYKPYAVIVGYTGGVDSNIALKLATMFFPVTAAFTCNTTIAAIETLMKCEKVATEHYNLKYISKMPPYGSKVENPDTYFELVKRHGFPGKTQTAHSWMYKYLKDHTIRTVVAGFRQRRRNRPIVIISGARKDESIRRMGTCEDITITEKGIWVNIANQWNKSEMAAFAKDNNIEQLRSECSRILGISGECWCGSYSKPGELTELKLVSPTTHEKIQHIQKWLYENTTMKWSWEEGPPKGFTLEKYGQLNMFSQQMIMCSTCMNNTES